MSTKDQYPKELELDNLAKPLITKKKPWKFNYFS